MSRFQGKIALVTGANSGIGAAITSRLIKDGAIVIAADITDSKESGGEMSSRIPYQIDVADAEQVSKLEDWILSRYKGLDLLFNNAGIGGVRVPFHEYPVEEFDKIHRVNIRGAFLILKMGLKLMLASGGGAVVNTASTGGFRATANACAYIISKGAMVMMTRSAALEYALRNIRVNAVAPGVTQTAIISKASESFVNELRARVPQGRLGTPQEVANVATFLADDNECSHVTGQIWNIDGGREAS